MTYLLSETPRPVALAAIGMSGAPSKRPALRVSGSHRLGTLATGALVLGVAVAILTTSDPYWWHLHYSQLGTFQDFSARAFNATVIVSGLLLTVYGIVIGVDLPERISQRRAMWIRCSISSAGAHMMMVGLIPIPVSSILHDIAATGLALSFLSFVASGLRCRALSNAFRRFAVVGVILLATGMVVLAAGLITLAFYESLAFSTMGVWLLGLPRAICAQDDETADAASPALVARSSPRENILTTYPAPIRAVRPSKPSTRERISPRAPAVPQLRRRSSWRRPSGHPRNLARARARLRLRAAVRARSRARAHARET